MKKLILSLIICINLLVLVSSVSALFYYDVAMKYNNGGITIDSVNVIFSHYNLGVDNYNNSESYSAKIDDKAFYFNVPTEQYYDVIDNETGLIARGGILERNDFEFNVIMPYSGSGKEIVIYDNKGNTLNKKSLIEFTRIYTKNEYNALIKQNDSDKENETNLIDEEFNEKTGFDYYTLAIIVLLIILVVLVLYYKIKEKPKKKK